MDEVTKVITDFKNEEKNMYARVNHKTFEADILGPICRGEFSKTIVEKWTFLADGVQIPMVITDDEGNDVITTPGLLDNKIAFELEDDHHLNDAVMEASKTSNPVSKKKVSDKLGHVLKHLKGSKWSQFIHEYEKVFGKKTSTNPQEKIHTKTGGVEIEDYDI